MQPRSNRSELLVETRLNELVREADRRVGHAVKLQRPDHVDPARPDEPTAGGPRHASRPRSWPIRACGGGTIAGQRGAAFLSAALWPSAYRAVTAAATPLVRYYLQRARPARQGRPRADRRTLRDRRCRTAAREAGLDPRRQRRRSAFGTGPDRADDRAAARPRNPADHRNRGIGAVARRAVAEPCPASVRAGRPAARRAAVPRPLASRSRDLGRIRAVAQSCARDTAPRDPDAAAQRPLVGAVVPALAQNAGADPAGAAGVRAVPGAGRAAGRAVPRPRRAQRGERRGFEIGGSFSCRPIRRNWPHCRAGSAIVRSGLPRARIPEKRKSPPPRISRSRASILGS